MLRVYNNETYASLVETVGKTTVESLAIIYEKFKTAFLRLCNSLLGCVLQKYVLKCIEIFITALITVTPNWKENNYPSTIEYTNWCIYTIKYYTTIKLNELLLHAGTQVNLTAG